MRRSIAGCLLLFVFCACSRDTTPAAPAAAASTDDGCAPAGDVWFACGLEGPEDLVRVPGTTWLVASAFEGDGGLYLIDTLDASTARLFPTDTASHRFERAAYPECPGPIARDGLRPYRTHGLYLKPGAGGPHTLYVVYHGRRESIEVFEMDTTAATPVLTWIGCAVAPEPLGLNSVVALPDGGFAATNFDHRSSLSGNLTAPLLAGERNGEVWEWRPGGSWTKVPGSEASGANGIELSADGRWYYISQWGTRAFTRLSRGATPIQRRDVPLGFRVDNIRWAPDGRLLVAGQSGSDDAILGRARGSGPDSVARSVVGKIDPETLAFEEILTYPISGTAGPATTAVQIGHQFWVGAFSGDRVAIHPIARP